MLHGKAVVEYESPQVRHARVQCPKCQKWFYPRDITTHTGATDLTTVIDYGHFMCPICNEEFRVPYKNIEETSNMPKTMITKKIWVMEE